MRKKAEPNDKERVMSNSYIIHIHVVVEKNVTGQLLRHAFTRKFNLKMYTNRHEHIDHFVVTNVNIFKIKKQNWKSCNIQVIKQETYIKCTKD